MRRETLWMLRFAEDESFSSYGVWERRQMCKRARAHTHLHTYTHARARVHRERESESERSTRDAQTRGSRISSLGGVAPQCP